MNLTTSSPDGRIHLTKATADLTDDTRDALGRSRCEWRCQEDKAKLWPVTFNLHLKGIFESKKEGRLAATIHLSGTWRKGAKAPEFDEAIRADLRRECVGTDLGGWTQQDIATRLVRHMMAATPAPLHAAAREGICKAMGDIAAMESQKGQAHIDRAFAANGVMRSLKK